MIVFTGTIDDSVSNRFGNENVSQWFHCTYLTLRFNFCSIKVVVIWGFNLLV